MSWHARMAGLALALNLSGQAAEVPAAATPAAAPTPTPAAVVQMPPMIVEESATSVPWLYVNAGNTEFLSRCSASVTRSLARAWLGKLQLLSVLLPEEFQLRLDAPAVFVLYAQNLPQAVSAEILQELQFAGGAAPGGHRVSIAPSMRLADRDMHAAIAYIDEAQFDAELLSISPNHVHYLLRGRVPELPAWLVEGVERMFRRADFVTSPVTLEPLVWHDPNVSDALAENAAHPRTLLPPGELFASDAVRAAENRHPRRVAARISGQDLFIRWAIVAGEPTREALWRFAARSAERPVDEELFEAHFGFGFSELRDRLSDYLPKAMTDTERIRPGRQAPLPPVEVRRATPGEVARVRGEWERLAIGHVQRHFPVAREPYIAQARRTLRRAYDAGDRDPRLLATMGLCEVDAGNDDGALEFLEPAVAARVVRPRAYHELARLRFAELRRRAPQTESFPLAELSPVLAPLRAVVAQAPQLADVYILLAQVWARCETSPNAEESAELQRGARLFPRRQEVGYSIAQALARHGKNAEAIAVLDTCAGAATEGDIEVEIARLRAELLAASARAAAEP